MSRRWPDSSAATTTSRRVAGGVPARSSSASWWPPSLGLLDRRRLARPGTSCASSRRVVGGRPWAPPTGDVNPKTLENAKRQFVELYGSALVLNTYLKIALVLVSLVALGLVAPQLPHRRTRRPRSSRSSFGSTTSGGPRPWRCDATPLPAAAARAAVLPDAVRGEALQPHPGDRPARVSRLAVLPRAGAGRRDDQPERAHAACSRCSSPTAPPTRSTSSCRTSA